MTERPAERFAREPQLTTRSAESRRQGRQQFLNGEVHNWYRLVLGYSDRTVAFLIDRLGIKKGDTVLDPFCGAGTTLVECMKRGIHSVGVDANPSSCFAAAVKTDWGLSPTILTSHLDRLRADSANYWRRKSVLRNDATYCYIQGSGMVDRGWIDVGPLEKALAIKLAIQHLPTTSRYRRAFMLALVAEVVAGASNVKFGPELYCGPAKVDPAVFQGFADRVQTMAADLKCAGRTEARVSVLHGDARDVCGVVDRRRRFDALISSPPYPAEHDYTRNARLELAFLEHVCDRESLRQIKRAMIRCHTKGIYQDDQDASLVARNRRVNTLANRIGRLAKAKTHCFAPLYSSVIRHYFGGMKRHMSSLWPFLKPGGHCAYVVGDQSGYLRVPIKTAHLLATLASEIGYKVVDEVCWREASGGKESSGLHENILILRKPNAGHDYA